MGIRKKTIDHKMFLMVIDRILLGNPTEIRDFTFSKHKTGIK